MNDQSRVTAKLEELRDLMEDVRWPYFIWLADPKTNADCCTGGGIEKLKDRVFEGVELIAREIPE